MSKRNQPQTTAPACRLAISQQALDETGLEAATWQVLVDSIFPTAKTVEGVLLAVRYCQARGLDVMKRPVHVVPMWNRALGREVETVWPGINEVQITAARTGQYAGLDPARFGPEQNQTFQGRAKTEDGWQDVRVSVTYPEWAEVTVYRLIGGVRCAFTETVFWLETYSRAGGAHSEVPTAMWIKRPRGQLLKCAKAASLRAAFPEEASYTAEEMAGKTIEPEELVVNRDVQPMTAEPEPVVDAEPTLSPEAREQIDNLIERASRSRAWASAQDYFRQRFQGVELAYALSELDQAERDSNAEMQAA